MKKRRFAVVYKDGHRATYESIYPVRVAGEFLVFTQYLGFDVYTSIPLVLIQSVETEDTAAVQL